MGSSKPSTVFSLQKRERTARFSLRRPRTEVCLLLVPRPLTHSIFKQWFEWQIWSPMRGAPRGVAFITRKTGEEREKACPPVTTLSLRMDLPSRRQSCCGTRGVRDAEAQAFAERAASAHDELKPTKKWASCQPFRYEVDAQSWMRMSPCLAFC